jgi:hypothetical protein
VRVTVARPDASVGNLLTQEKLGAPIVIDADTIPPRQATLMRIENRTGKPAVGYTLHPFDLFDDIMSTGFPEPAGVFGRLLPDLLTVEGNYTFHFQASYGDACIATRELVWSVHVHPGIDPRHTSVTSRFTGGRRTLTIVPRDRYGNHLGPGMGDAISVTSAPGTTVTEPLRDNGDGSYSVTVEWDPNSSTSPGVAIGQPGRPPVVVSDTSVAGKDSCRYWKIAFWIVLVIALILLLLRLL